MSPEKIARRDFLKKTIYTTGALVGIGSIPGIVNEFTDVLPDDSIENLKVCPSFPLPQELRGLSMNSPFLHCFPEAQNSVISDSLKAGVTNLRIFIDDAFEPTLGDYKNNVISSIKNLHQNIASQTDTLHTIVSLYDAYGMTERLNLVHGRNKITSPYCDGSPEDYRKFFTDEKIKSRFLNRAKIIIESLGDTNVVSAWEVGNEFSPPAGEDGQAIFQDWFSAAAGSISKMDPAKRPIISGVARPWYIDERGFEGVGLINTIHIYPAPFIFNDFRDYLGREDRRLPLFVEEIGFPGKLLEMNIPPSLVDAFYNNFLNMAIRSATFSKNLLAIDGLVPWKIDGYEDGYPNPLNMPLTRETAVKFGSITKL